VLLAPLAAAAALLAAGCGGGRHPDVVLVLVDTLRPDRLGAYGYGRPTSPNLDALARDAVVFHHAVSPATWTKPAIASLFTALYPAEHGIVRQLRRQHRRLVAQALPAAAPTLAERFRAGGYRTVGVVHQPNLSPTMGFDRGFETYAHRQQADDFALVRDLLGELDRLGTGRPVFAYLHLLDVHWPYVERLPGLAEDAFGPIDPDDELSRQRAAVHVARKRGFRGIDLATLGATYDHGVAWTDAAIGKLIEGLRARERWRDTVFVVASDHGEALLEHGRLEHSYHAPYDEIVRIPLFVRAPGRAVPGARDSLVSLLDLGPTLVELAGLPPWTGVSGRSFLPLLAGAEDPGRVALIESEQGRALRSRAAKLIVDRRDRLEFYDLAADPAEQRNLARPACVGPCRAQLARLRQVEASLRPPLSREGAAVDYTPEQIEELRNLGYL
jgi:arylsulfatase A-like enzyme